MSGPDARPARYADLKKRVLYGVGLALGGLFCVLMGGALAGAAVFALVGVMLWEYHRMILRHHHWITPSLLICILGGAIAALCIGFGAIQPGLIILLVSAFIAAILARQETGWLVAGIGYIVVPMGILLALRIHEGWSSVRIVLWIFFIVIASDIGAYFVGRRMGGPKLWARVSPGKTWSGAIGGLVAAGIMSVIFSFIMEWRPTTTIAATLVLVVASQAGDLLESSIKRRYGVKDSSHLLPGHGGFLDRMDAVLGAVWALAVLMLLGLDVSVA